MQSFPSSYLLAPVWLKRSAALLADDTLLISPVTDCSTQLFFFLTLSSDNSCCIFCSTWLGRHPNSISIKLRSSPLDSELIYVLPFVAGTLPESGLLAPPGHDWVYIILSLAISAVKRSFLSLMAGELGKQPVSVMQM